jgi:catechol 2,3-dioxygenase-like lactoylglutathione lyase family enzyme
MRTVLFVALSLATVAAGSGHRGAAPAGFPRTTIDIGVHVRDIEASAGFYANVIGFTEVEGFTVAADFASAAGLTDRQPLAVRVFVLGEGESATKLKLMQVPGVTIAEGDNAYIHSQLGFRYLTIFIDNTTDALKRLRAAGVQPVGDGPILIGDDPSGSYLTVVRDPDGNLIELIGPSK